jgi:hypothetical protein
MPWPASKQNHRSRTLLPTSRKRFSAALSSRRWPRFVLLGACLGYPCVFPELADAQSQQALQFDGLNDYVTFGSAPNLGVSTFTIELRFKRTGPGSTTSTGTGGVTAVPLLTKGRSETDGSNVDMNFFLGFRATDNVLVADYEEGTGQTTPGLNHPVAGITPIATGVWYHAAATFDGTTWRLFLNGNLEATLVVGSGRLPQSASIQHAALATAMNSGGTASGFFQGIIDEARVWNVARPQQEIQAGSSIEILSGTGLVARWGLNEGAGTSAGNSIAGGVSGTLTNGPVWTNDSPIPLASATALKLGSGGAYVTFGNPATLQLSTFTIETWFRRDGAGVAINTGGVPDLVPIIAKGRAESEAASVDINYALGISSSSGLLCADFEEGPGGASPSLNHPVTGVTPITTGVWHHGAATYDGTRWQLFLDGHLEADVVVGQPTASASTVAVSLGTALNSLNAPAGSFDGALDEARIWNVALSEEEVQSTVNAEITGTSPGLVGRWGLNEDAGTVVSSTAGTTLNGAIVGSDWSWASSAPLNLGPPAAPTGLSASATISSQVDLIWNDLATNESSYQLDRSTSGSEGPFTPLVTLPANRTSYSDVGLSSNAEYCYRVRAVNQVANSNYDGPACATTPIVTSTALDFGSAGTTYASFGNPAVLRLSAFTIELWLRRDGPGVSLSTGTGGLSNAVPLVAKGRAESEAASVDINYLLGIRASDGVLCADFEEGTGGSSPSLNHPVVGFTSLASGVWHHAAATYDGATWKLFLDGALDAQLGVGQPPASASSVAVSLGTALNSTNVPAGFFDGVVDEVRIWNYARSATEILSTVNAQITTPQAGLVARWALDEGSGSSISGSAGTSVSGSITGTNFTWGSGAPFNLVVNQPPAQPALSGPANDASGVPFPPTLDVMVSDPESSNLTVTYYGRPIVSTPGPDFTLIGLPDTQFYTGQLNGGSNAIFKAQTNWIVAQRATRNIPYVVQLGDCVENGDNGGNPIEWVRADTSLRIIEDPVNTGMPEGLPYGVCVGNHDQSPIGDADGTTTYYNQYFGIGRFQGRNYYGGHYGTSNDNWYDLFSASGMDFIVVSLEYDTSPDPAVLSWADNLLTTYSDRRAIIASHYIINSGNPATFGVQGQAIYDALKGHANLFLMLCGHVSPPEGRRSDTFNGNTVNTLLSDYQSRTNGGDGWLRIMEFSPANNVIRVRTYSPWLNQFEADADSSSQFTLTYPMSSAAPFQVIGSTNVASGSHATMTWSGLAPNTQYEWYVVASDGGATTTGPVWRFTTGADVTPPAVQVIFPDGTETLAIGQTATLQWQATDNVSVSSVDLLLSRAGASGTFESVAAGVANTGSYGWIVTDPTTTNAFLKVVAHDLSGNNGEDLSDVGFKITDGIVGVGPEPVREVELGVPTPNPVVSRTHIGFGLPREAAISLTLLDIQGRQVASITHGVFAAGRHDVTWNGRSAQGSVPGGLYFLRLQAAGVLRTRKLLLMRGF